MKDIGLSTRSYVVMDNTNKPLFQVNREHILGQNELQVNSDFIVHIGYFSLALFLIILCCSTRLLNDFCHCRHNLHASS